VPSHSVSTVPGLGKKYELKTKDKSRKLFIFYNSKDVKNLSIINEIEDKLDTTITIY